MRKLIPLTAVLTALGLAGVAAAQPPGPPPFRPGGPPPGGAGPGLERLLDDLRLDDKQAAQARKAIDAFDAKMRQSRDDGFDELRRKVRDILTAEQYRQFRDELDRLPAGRGGPGGRGPRGVPTDDLVRHVMAFDKDGDGKVTREELPERMHRLIELGDKNNDGALDREELTKLAEKLQQVEADRPAPRGPRGRVGPPDIERAVGELKLEDKQKDEVRKALAAHREKMRKLTDEARADLVAKMKDVLSTEQLTRFKDGLDRLPPPGRPGGRGPRP
jgi:Spy/CpxP family protein refolding chaperone